MDPQLVERTDRITPQEWRVIALAIEGVPPSQQCDALGIAMGTLESHRQAIRRKLAIPRGQRFESFVRGNLAGDVRVNEMKAPPRQVVDPATSERRVRWLLRLTLQEVSEVGLSATLRAELLGQTVERMGSDNADEARSEIEDLRAVAAEMRAVYEKMLERARQH